MTKMLSVQQAASRLGCSNQCVRKWMQTGISGVILPSVKFGGRRKVLEQDLAEFIDKITVVGFEKENNGRLPAEMQKGYVNAIQYLDELKKSIHRN